MFTGGNCLTTMIATISLEMTNLSESISTCRFAQRVSCISNTARFVKILYSTQSFFFPSDDSVYDVFGC